MRARAGSGRPQTPAPRSIWIVIAIAVYAPRVRLPLHKVYRAFPELDGLTDAQCEAYVRGAERAEPWRRVLGLAACIFITVGAAALLLWPAQWLGDQFLGVLSPMTSGAARALVIALLVAAGPLLLALSFRDRWLRIAITRQIRRDRCPRCDYSLVGLEALAGVLVCPECGRAWRSGPGGLEPAPDPAKNTTRDAESVPR